MATVTVPMLVDGVTLELSGGVAQIKNAGVTAAKLSPGNFRILSSVQAAANRTVTAQTLVTATDTAVSFDTEERDTNAFIDLVAQPTRITVPAGFGGLLLFIGQLEFAANGVGLRRGYVQKNGAGDAIRGSLNRITSFAAANNVNMEIVGWDVAAVGDYYQLKAFQDSGGNLDLVHNGTTPPRLLALFLGA